MDYFSDVYNLRLNRYGDNFAERVQGRRAADFERYKNRSTYRVEFEDNCGIVVGTLEPNKQDETEATQWLLVDLDKKYENGTIFNIPKENCEDSYWMVWYERETRSKGYNKYLMLRMTHLISWYDRDGNLQESWGYFFGKMDRIIYDVVRSTAKMSNYQDPNKETHIIMPKTECLKRQDYLVIDGEGYYVTGYDLSSTPGVEYFSLKETQLRTDAEPTDKIPGNKDDDELFWLQGD